MVSHLGLENLPNNARHQGTQGRMAGNRMSARSSWRVDSSHYPARNGLECRNSSLERIGVTIGHQDGLVLESKVLGFAQLLRVREWLGGSGF